MRPETELLADRITELRDERWSWDRIGREVGRSATRAQQLYLERATTVPVSSVIAAREEDLRLVDGAIRRLLADITIDEQNDRGSIRSRAESWGQVRMFLERRARLMGTDAPLRREVQFISEDAVDAELVRLSRQVAALDARRPTLDDMDVEGRTP